MENKKIVSKEDLFDVISGIGNTTYDIFKDKLSEALKIIVEENNLKVDDVIYIVTNFLLSFNLSVQQLLIKLVNNLVDGKKFHKEMIECFLEELKTSLNKFLEYE